MPVFRPSQRTLQHGNSTTKRRQPQTVKIVSPVALQPCTTVAALLAAHLRVWGGASPGNRSRVFAGGCQARESLASTTRPSRPTARPTARSSCPRPIRRAKSISRQTTSRWRTSSQRRCAALPSCRRQRCVFAARYPACGGTPRCAVPGVHQCQPVGEGDPRGLATTIRPRCLGPSGSCRDPRECGKATDGRDLGDAGGADQKWDVARRQTAHAHLARRAAVLDRSR